MSEIVLALQSRIVSGIILRTAKIISLLFYSHGRSLHSLTLP